MTPSEALAKIKALAKVSFDNGDSPENVEAAANQIGHLVMTFPDIFDSMNRSSNSRSGGSGRQDSRDDRDHDRGRSSTSGAGRSQSSANGTGKRETKYVTFDHDGIGKETEKAVCITFRGRQIWIPKGQIETVSKTQITVTEWIANEKHMLDEE
jgi:hypothetical protein